MRALIRISVALPLLVFGSGCSLTVPDYNGIGLGDLEANPTKATIASAITGILVMSRSENLSPQVGYIESIGMMGRESYTLDVSNPGTARDRFDVLVSGRAGAVWQLAYQSIRQQTVILKAIDAVADMTAAEKEAVQGFIQTIQARDLLYVINLMEVGAIADIKPDPGGPLAPIVPKVQVFARIVQLLDQAKAHLQNGGASFPMPLGPGFAGFDTPASFLGANRALKARVDVYLGNYSTALTELGESFLNTSAGLTLGVYDAFSTNSGDVSNVYYDPLPRIIYSHPSDVTDAQQRTDGTADLRVAAKVAPITPKLQIGYQVDGRLLVYNSPNAFIPIIRNEELILLRAEANLGLNNTSAAIADINLIRVNAGGLPPISDPYVPNAALGQPATLLDELLYEKRYSLLFEGHRWIDLRRYGKLTTLPKAHPTDQIFPWFPLPDDECVLRNQAPPGCTPPAGM